FVHAAHPPLAAISVQALEDRAPEAEHRRVREVRVDRGPEQADRHAKRRLAIPRDLRDLERALRPEEQRSAELDGDGHISPADAVEIPERGSREVVAARKGDIDTRRAFETGDDRGRPRPEEALRRTRPEA